MADYHNYNTTLASNILEAIPKLIQKYEDNPDITLSELLQKTDTETLENGISECLTEENDYDDFHEHHTSLATIFHERLKSEKLWNVYVFPYYDSTADKYFKTKKECKKFRDRIIKKYYNKADEAFNIIKSLTDNSYENLYKDFDKELDHGRDYYEMYDFDYFVDTAEIEEHDYRIETDMFTLALETLFADSMEYSVPGLYYLVH